MAVLSALQLTNRRGKRTRIGLDIGTHGVRAVQLLRQSQPQGPGSPRGLEGYVVMSAACSDRNLSEPALSAVGGTGQNAALGSRIRSLVRADRGGRACFQGKSAAVAFAPPDVEFHTLELPAAVFRTDGAEEEQVVRIEVERLMTQQAAQVETRHWRLPQTSVPAPNAIGAGAAHEIIDATIEVCAEAGLTCTNLDTTATALGRFGALLQSRPQDQVWGVLDVGDRQTRLVLCLDNTPVLVRTAGAGGRTWTQRIAEALQVSFKAAEIHKRDHGIALTGRQARAPAEEGTRGELASLILGAVRADLNDLASEVKRSYEYVLSCYPGRQAGDLVLCGGGSLLRHLPEFLGSALGIPVRRASSYLQAAEAPPWPTGACRLRFAADPSAPLEVLAVAVGLALENSFCASLPREEAGGATVALNLIPESVQAGQARGRHVKRWAACLAVSSAVAVMPVGAHWMQHVRIGELRAQSDKLQIDLAAARTELKTATAAANEAFLRIERAKALRTKRAWSNMLALIGSCLPKDCWLTSIATDPDVPPAAPLARTNPPPATESPASSLGKGVPKGSTRETEKPAVVIIEAPRKLRMTGEATDATQPLSFVTRLKESQVFREVTLERSLREKSNPGDGVEESNYRFELICEW